MRSSAKTRLEQQLQSAELKQLLLKSETQLLQMEMVDSLAEDSEKANNARIKQEILQVIDQIKKIMARLAEQETKDIEAKLEDTISRLESRRGTKYSSDDKILVKHYLAKNYGDVQTYQDKLVDSKEYEGFADSYANILRMSLQIIAQGAEKHLKDNKATVTELTRDTTDKTIGRAQNNVNSKERLFSKQTTPSAKPELPKGFTPPGM